MTSSPSSAAPGWYSDPHGQQALRWFDGSAWTAHVAAAPAYPPQPAVAYAPGSHQTPSLGESPSDPVHWLVPTGRTWQSIAAGYAGLLSLGLWILGPVAIGLGIWALQASGRGGGHGRVRAVFGIITGALGTLILVAVVT
jgi:hypothetical protein